MPPSFRRRILLMCLGVSLFAQARAFAQTGELSAAAIAGDSAVSTVTLEAMVAQGQGSAIPVEDIVNYATLSYREKNWPESLRRHDLVYELHPELAAARQYVNRQGEQVSLARFDFQRVMSACNIRPEDERFFARADEFVKKYPPDGQWVDEITLQVAWRKFHDRPRESVNDLKNFLARYPNSRRHPFALILLVRLLNYQERDDEFFHAIRTYGPSHRDIGTLSEILRNARRVLKRIAEKNEPERELYEDLRDAIHSEYMKIPPTQVNLVQRLEAITVMSQEPDYDQAAADLEYALEKQPDLLSRADPKASGSYGALEYWYAHALSRKSEPELWKAKSLLEGCLNNPDFQQRKTDMYPLMETMLKRINRQIADAESK